MNPVLAADLSALPGIRHAFFTREGGVSQGIYASLNGGTGSSDDPAAVAENRRRMEEWLGVAPGHLLGVHQVHSPDVVIAREPWSERPRADAIVTSTSGLALGVSSADCGPLLFADSEAGIIGAAHSGWRGAFEGVAQATIDAMEREGARRERIIAVLGPTISAAAYEVGPEFKARFIDQDTSFSRFFTPSDREGHAFFDLPAFIGFRIGQTGVGRFIDLGLCTYADETRFYSYRRTVHRKEADYGRLIAAIALV